MKSQSKLLTLLYLAFLISLFLYRIPSFYIFDTASKLLVSHTISKVVDIVIFISLLIIFFLKRRRYDLQINMHLIVLLLLFILSQSLSVILFFKFYHNFILGIIIFLLTFFFVKQNKIENFEKYLLSCGLILTLGAFIYSLFSNQILLILKPFIQNEFMYAFLTDLSRDRRTLSLGQEIFLPFFIIKINGNKKIFFLLSSLLITYLSIVSNYRSFLIMVLFIWLSFFIFSKKINIKIPRVLLGTSIFFIFLFTALTTYSGNGVSFLDRLSLTDVNNSLGSIQYRISATQKSIDLFFSSPITGIGLGNYYIYQKKQRPLVKGYQASYNDQVIYSPHNIIFQYLAETGFLGLFTFLLLVMYFLKKDLGILFLSSTNIPIFPYIVSFWSIMLFFLFNPANSIIYLSWFWFIRGIIEGKN